MSLSVLRIEKGGQGSLQARLRAQISRAIGSGMLAAGQSLPSTRLLAQQLGISRNTVTLVYQELASEGFLRIRQRHGFYVAPDFVPRAPAVPATQPRDSVGWEERLTFTPSVMDRGRMPPGWRGKRYIFTYGQHDQWMFPTASWRRCSRDALSVTDVNDWAVDYNDSDDPLLIEGFRSRALPWRGLAVGQDEILFTVGAQHALFLVSQLLTRPGSVVGVEEPGYPDARSIFSLFGATIRPLPIDEQGLIVDERLKGCDLVFVTPSHQSPTQISMSAERRRALLAAADAHDFLVVEDDYDVEVRFRQQHSAALKSIDDNGRVIYVSSVSKLLSPGLRIGLLVAAPPLIEEARALRRFSVRHPPANNQRTVAHFLRGGHYEAQLGRFHQKYEQRWRILGEAIARHLPDCATWPSKGGNSYWLKAPEGVDTDELARRAFEADVVIEAGSTYFAGPVRPRTHFRVGFSSIEPPDIDEGIKVLAGVLRSMRPGG